MITCKFLRAVTIACSVLAAVAAPAAIAQQMPPDGEVVMRIHRDGLAYDAAGEQHAAVSMFGQACDMGLAAACTMAGRVEHDLASNGKDHIRSARMFAKACRMGDELGCAGTGLALGPLSRANSTEPEGLTTLALLMMGEECRHEGGAQACVDAADLLGSGDDIGIDLAAVREYAVRACADEDRAGCAGLAVFPDVGNSPAEIREMREAACMAGRASGCDALLDELIAGADGKYREDNVALLQKACGEWVGIACADLGLYYSQGPEEYRQPDLARSFMRLGCDAFVAKACFAFSVMHKKGIGGPANEKRAVSLVGHACELGERKACNTLALIATSSDDGIAAGHTPEQARARACRLGERQACLPANEGTES